MNRNEAKHRDSRLTGVETDDDGKGVALYHIVYEAEGFDEAAHALFELVRETERIHPGQPRHLSLDIEGHKSQVDLPLAGRIMNSRPQRSDIPEELVINAVEK